MGPVLTELADPRRAPQARPGASSPRHELGARVVDRGRPGVLQLPRALRLTGEWRTLPGESAADVERELRGLIARSGVEAEPTLLFAGDPLGRRRTPRSSGSSSGHVGTTIVGVPYWADSAPLAAAGIPTVLVRPRRGRRARDRRVGRARLGRAALRRAGRDRPRLLRRARATRRPEARRHGERSRRWPAVLWRLDRASPAGRADRIRESSPGGRPERLLLPLDVELGQQLGHGHRGPLIRVAAPITAPPIGASCLEPRAGDACEYLAGVDAGGNRGQPGWSSAISADSRCSVSTAAAAPPA